MATDLSARVATAVTMPPWIARGAWRAHVRPSLEDQTVLVEQSRPMGALSMR
jgi:hypothetical protein